MNTQIQINFSNVHENSSCAYKEKVLPTLSKRKLEVLEAIKALGGSSTLFDIGQYLKRDLNTFSGRISELKKSGLIEDTKEKKVINSRIFSILKLNK